MRDFAGGAKRKASFVGSHFMAICLGLLVMALAITMLTNCSGSTATQPDASRTYERTSAAPSTKGQPPTAKDGLRTVAYAELPKQAQTTIKLIDAGGPFPYPRDDGKTYRNREGHLPKQKPGYYQEYTVKTPGESDRGARRIVVGQNGTMYYTSDHYNSFRRIVR